MESVGDHSGAAVSDEIGPDDDADIAKAGVDGIVAYGGGELQAFGGGGFEVEVHHVRVLWMIESTQSALQGFGIAGRPRDEVGEFGKRIGRRDWSRRSEAEFLFDEERGI